MEDQGRTEEDEAIVDAAAEAAPDDDQPIPAPGEVIQRAIPTRDPDRFTWPPRPSLVLGLSIAVVSIVVALRGHVWSIAGFVIAAMLIMWPRVRAYIEFGGGQHVPRVRGGVTEPVELDDASRADETKQQ